MLRGLHPLCGICWFFLVWSQLVCSQSFTPAAIPLAVRSPYFSTWLSTTNGTDFTNAWPQFWSGTNGHNNGWAGLVRVDGDTYRWLGAAPGMNDTNLTRSQVTPTRTVWTIQAGPMSLTVTFLTPIEPSDWVRQSMPFSYLSFEAAATDGKSHSVQVYSDVSAEWLSGNLSALVRWNTTTTNQLIYHQVELQNPTQFEEVSDQAVDGSLYYAMAQGKSATYQSGQDSVVRGQFVKSGTLQNTQDTDFRSIAPNYPVFGLAVDLGNIQSTQSPVVWSVGYVRDPSIQYTTGSGTVQNRSPYYVTQYSSVEDMTRSTQLDNEITQNATNISSEYSDLVSLAARQTFGAIDITWNTSDVMIFMKDMGTSRRVNPVEVMYAAFPMFLYVNASYGGSLLKPLLEFQTSRMYSLPYAASDLGTSYPLASGDTSSGQQGLEDTADMIIMALAHARASGDGSLLVQYYGLLKSWTDYLVENSKTPVNQVSADNQNTANMTNLAIKGIIAIEAMSQIATAVRNTSDADNYARMGIVGTVAKRGAGAAVQLREFNSWALMYNLYADLLLGTKVISQSVYDRQGDYYNSLISDGTSRTYGLPIDSADAVQGSSAWLSFTAATANSSVRDQFISMIWKRATYNKTAGVFPAAYDVDSGAVTNGAARYAMHGTCPYEITHVAHSPAQGAMFALMALDIANKTISPGTATSDSSSDKHIGGIVGGVVGGVGGLALIVAAVFFWRRRRARSAQVTYEKTEIDESAVVSPEPFPYQTTPYVPPAADQTQTTDTSQSPPPVPVMSSKLREHLRHITPHAPASSASGSGTHTSGSRYSQDPPTTAGASTSPSARSEIHGLRAEVENLRMYMEQMHAQQLEAPPSYAEE
ncbi:uncharacterized protein B0H18DRAFT_1082345 [Fomitopsis serialis]|uniref:uncharacterized protein n=1 Tax=Fomitopsis serialis TaxID=139415 RepID=UPI00200787A0|nr:uncharacterized protein B0H18DRAFT_1082345 [Neoantrodia serialis]KAH9935633.1 hypothetical protein B0H18DRAFT_1082345 [Neoantrodia serialis]